MKKEFFMCNTNRTEIANNVFFFAYFVIRMIDSRNYLPENISADDESFDSQMYSLQSILAISISLCTA